MICNACRLAGRHLIGRGSGSGSGPLSPLALSISSSWGYSSSSSTSTYGTVATGRAPAPAWPQPASRPVARRVAAQSPWMPTSSPSTALTGQPARSLAAAYPYHMSRRRFSSTAATADSVDESATAPSAAPPKPDFLDEAESHIWDLLCKAFAPAELSVRDISGGCGSMYGIEISSDKFRGANMLKQQRMVNAVLGDLMKDWHGVQLKTRVP